MKLTTRKVNGELVVEGKYLAWRTFSRPEKVKLSWRDRLETALWSLVVRFRGTEGHNEG